MRVLYTTQLHNELAAIGLIEKIKSLPDLGESAKKAIVHELKHSVTHVAENLKITKGAVVKAIKEPKLSNMLDACGYSFATMYGAFHMGHKVAEEGALHVMAFLAEHTALHKLAHNSAHKVKAVDDFIEKYPVLKKVTGPALAGLMLYGYTLTEPHKLGDWDLSHVKAAFAGEFGVKDFMHTSEALYLGTHVAKGEVMSMSHLAENMTTLAVGLTCTAIMQSNNPKLRAVGDKIKSTYAKFKTKKSPLEELQDSKNFTGDEALKKKVKFDPDLHGEPRDTQEMQKQVQQQHRDRLDKDKQDDKPAKKDDDGKDGKSKSRQPGWWRKLTKHDQKQYLKDHPDSDYKVTK